MTTLSHKKSQLVTLKQLKALPMPVSRGAVHNPIPHHLLVETLEVEALERGYTIKQQQFALGMSGSALFGVMDLMPPGVVSVEERGLSIGFRNSTNAKLAIKMVAGARVFVCDNLMLSGDMIAVLRRNTLRLDLDVALKQGFDKFAAHATTLERHILRLQAQMITDLEAKAKVFDVFAQRILPVHLFDDVEQAYFHPTDAMEDCQPRTAWGLHNACTRAMKQLGPTRSFGANVALGRAFGLTEE